MFADLPKTAQEMILYYLATNNFAAAKDLYDQLLAFSTVDVGKNPKDTRAPRGEQ